MAVLFSPVETPDEIRTFLSAYDLASLRQLFEIVQVSFREDTDIMMLLDSDYPSLRSLFRDENVSLPYEKNNIFSPDQIEIIKKIVLRKEGKTGPNRKTVISLLTQVCTDPILLERVILSRVNLPDDMLQSLMNALGCPNTGRQCLEDPVFQNRRAYISKIISYMHAMVHLYGVITLYDLEEMLQKYEARLLGSTADYQHAGMLGGKTIFYSPAFFCPFQLNQIIEDCNTKGDFITLDGLLVHSSFEMDYLKEIEELSHYVEKHRSASSLSQFLENISDAPYRLLFEEQEEKPQYLPPKKELLRYADAEYHEVSAAEREMRSYLNRHFPKELEAAAKKEGLSRAQMLDQVMSKVYSYASDVGHYPEELEIAEQAQALLNDLAEIGIAATGEDQLNEIISLQMRMHNSARQWCNHGYTPDELFLMQRRSGNFHPTITPMSTTAAQMLQQNREEIEKMGFPVDLESTATDIPTLDFPNGLGGQPVRGTEKIYPNDPCPCGSGKKYKKCCGRKK